MNLFGDYNEGTLLFLGGWGPGWIALFAVIAVVVLGLTWIDLRDLRGRRRGTLMATRALALGAGVLLLLEPALELRQVTHLRNHVAVLLDTSASQSLADDGTVRLDRGQEVIRELEPLLTEVHEEHFFDLFTFDDGLEPSTYDALVSAELTAAGESTGILEAIEAVTDRYGRRDLGGIILVSDGIDLQSLGGRVRRGEPLDADTLAQLEALGVPIHTFVTAPSGELTDLAIRRVLHDDFAFVRNAVSVVVEVRALGELDQAIPVTLYRAGEPLQTRMLRLEPGVENYRVEFDFVPELIGKEVYQVSLPVLEGEALDENNDAFFVINVIRDKIRALLVVGRPSWDERMLRQLLQGNPNVDLISFFILRTNEDVARAGNSELSLIPFPTDELFHEELGSFDLVILQNFSYEPYGMRQYLDDIRDYVLNGGGLMMVGGEQSFASGGYGSTEITDILPVRLPTGGSSATLVDEGLFRPVLTDAGHRHPITRLEFSPQANQELWDTLPPMRGTNVVLGAQPGATVLATHPTRTGDEGPMPVIAVSDMGAGRSMALTMDSTWRWSFDYIAEGGSSRPYSSFFNSAIRWLIRDPELNLVHVTLDEEVFTPGETATAHVRIYRPDYSPAEFAEGTIYVTRRDLDELATGQDIIVLEAPFEADAQGRFNVDIPVTEPGAYTVRATARVEDETEAEDSEIFLGITQRPELADIAPRPDLLAAISEATGGRHEVLPVRRIRDLEFAPARVVQIDRRRVIDLWNTPWVLLLFVLLLGADWSLRRRWGRL